MKPGIYNGLSEAAYFADPALSSTEARWLLEAPAVYRWNKDHPRDDSTAAFDLGSAVHTKVLGTGWDVIELDYPDWRSKQAQNARDEARANGQIPMLAKDMRPVYAMAESVLAHPTARALFEADGTAEASVFSVDPLTGVSVKARFDRLNTHCAVDLKTTAGKASPDGFTKSVAGFGYHVQEGHYIDAYANITGEMLPFKFVVVEKAPPYLVGVYELDEHFKEIGADAAKKARELYAECLASNEWPGYPEEVQQLAPPAWLAWAHEEEQAEIEIA